MDKHKGHALLGSSLLGVHTSPHPQYGPMVMPDWDWVVLLSAVWLAVSAVMGWSLYELSELFDFFCMT